MKKMELNALFDKLNCPIEIKEKNVTYVPNISIKENISICYVSTEHPSESYTIDYQVIKGVGETFEIAIKELKKDLFSKKTKNKNRKKEKKPSILNKKDIDLTELTDACKQYIDYLNSDDYNEDDTGDYEHTIFNNAVEAVYGKKIWDYVNKRLI